MFSFNAGLSALRSSQLAMDIVANNIANANTPGYHRQTVRQVEDQPLYDGQFWRGTGASISRINQIASRAVESALTRNIASLSQVDQALNIASQVERRLSPSAGSLNERLQQFFDELHAWQGQPDNGTRRHVVINKSRTLANELNSITADLGSLQTATRQDIDQEIESVNRQLEALSRLDRQITQAQAAGQQPNSLLDAHQQLVNEIAESIDIVALPRERGFAYQFAQNHVSISHTTFAIEAHYLNDGTVTFTRPDGTTPLEFGGGRLAASAQALNDLIPALQQQLDELAATLIQELDHVQSTGVSASGPFNLLTTHRVVRDASLPLTDAGLPFDIARGELFVSIHDPEGGISQNRISIDPNTQSLQDIADEISQLPHLQAVINPDTNALSILAEPGYGFDFAGQLPDAPDRSGVSGDALIAFSGVYQGTDNRTLRFEVIGSGQVGVSESLSLGVLDESGQVLSEFNLGRGYEPGSVIDVGDGVSLAIESGQLGDKDSFEVFAVADADTSRLLVGLGLNTFFEGTRAGDIRVSAEISDHPDRLAAGRTLHAGDGSNIERMLRLRQQPLVADSLSFEDFVDGMTADIAIEVNELTFMQTDLAVYDNSLLREREAISGVDPNEEMVLMLQYQRSFQAATRVITAIDETLAELMNMVR